MFHYPFIRCVRPVLSVLRGREIILVIDETGDRKKGEATDYVKRQYIVNLGKVENGIVAVTAYGLLEGMTFSLMFEVYKPKKRLLESDVYQTSARNCSKNGKKPERVYRTNPRVVKKPVSKFRSKKPRHRGIASQTNPPIFFILSTA